MSLRSSSSISDTDKGFFLKTSRPDMVRTQLRIQRVPVALFREVKRRAVVSFHTTPTRTEVNNSWSFTSAIPCAFTACSGTTLLHFKPSYFILGSSQFLIHPPPPHRLILPEIVVLLTKPWRNFGTVLRTRPRPLQCSSQCIAH
jgi:hypothetical protein